MNQATTNPNDNYVESEITVIHPDILPPFSELAEQVLLGAALTRLNGFQICKKHIEKPKDFFFLKHQYIWEAVENLVEKFEKSDAAVYPDYVTCLDELQRLGYMDIIPMGPAYLAHLVHLTPNSYNLEAYAIVVKDYALRRELLELSARIYSNALDLRVGVDDSIADIRAELDELAAKTNQKDGTWMYEILHDMVTDTIDRYENKTDTTNSGISTGSKRVDDLLGGFHNGDLTVVAGRPGMGKSAFLVNIIHAAMQENKRVCMFSLEMNEKSIGHRLVAHMSEVPVDKQLKPFTMNAHEQKKFTDLLVELEHHYFMVEDVAELDEQTLMNRILRYDRKYNFDIYLVDGIYKMHSYRPTKSKHEEFGNIARGLKRTARQVNKPIIATHQLSRAVESRPDKRPMLSDLRESGSIEEEANQVVMLYRSDYYNNQNRSLDATYFDNTEVIVAKNRDGQTGTAEVYFESRLTRFLDPETLQQWMAEGKFGTDLQQKSNIKTER